MDIKTTHSLICQFLKTTASPQQLADCLSVCGPTVDNLTKTKDDYIYDIEIITNRIDSASALGIAREASAILPRFGYKAKFKSPRVEPISTPTQNNLPLNVQIIDGSLAKRFCAIILDSIKIKPSPNMISNQLESCSIRAQNNLVDITNYLTLLYGQPVHIFDYDKIKGSTMKLRTSKNGEMVTTLDNRSHVLRGDDIVIEDGSGQLIDLCGIMGAKNSEVDENTSRAVLFVQTYDPHRIRTTSLYTQERTLAAQIFEKEPDPELVLPTLYAGIRLIRKHCHGIVASKIIDIYPNPIPQQSIKLDIDWLTNLIGESVPRNVIKSSLKSLGFKLNLLNTKQLIVRVPSWRINDCKLPHDIAEEISRVYGYFRLSGKIPSLSSAPSNSNHQLQREYDVRSYIANLGLTEIYSHSLISPQLLKFSQLTSENLVKVTNPLSIDNSIMRPSLIPSLIETISLNKGKVDPPIRIFEVSQIYTKNTNSALPYEKPSLAMAFYGDDYLTAKGYLENIFKHFNAADIHFTKLNSLYGPFEKTQTAIIGTGSTIIGHIGQISNQTLLAFQLPLTHKLILIDLDISILTGQFIVQRNLKSLPSFPTLVEDITLKSSLPIGELIENIYRTDPRISRVIFKESFHNQHTFRISILDVSKNLSEKEATQIKNKLRRLDQNF